VQYVLQLCVLTLTQVDGVEVTLRITDNTKLDMLTAILKWDDH